MFTFMNAIEFLNTLKNNPFHAKTLLNNVMVQTKDDPQGRSHLLNYLLSDHIAIRFVPLFLSFDDGLTEYTVGFSKKTLPISITMDDNREYASAAIEHAISVISYNKSGVRLLIYLLKHIKNQTLLQYMITMSCDTDPRLFNYAFTYYVRDSHKNMMTYLKKCPEWQKPHILNKIA